MKKNLKLVVTENSMLNNNYCLIKLTTTDQTALPEMYPGQFVQVKVDNSQTTFLRRPISVNYVDKAKNELWLLIQLVGDGTKTLSKCKKDDILDLLLPLGNTFTAPKSNTDKLLLVGGGVGTAPMLYLGAKLSSEGFEVDFLLGARSEKDLLELDDFSKYGKVYTTTEDGSMGEKGFVTNHSILQNSKYDRIYTCGPKPMMVAIARYAHTNDISCEVSLENMMACGFGACLCCVEKTMRGNVCVCTEGPVFDIKELTWID